LASAYGPNENDTGAIGQIVQVVFERQHTDRSRAGVLRHFVCDVMLLNMFLGMTVRTVNAAGTPAEPGRDPLGPRSKKLPALANLSVILGCDGQTVRWSIGPAVDDEGAKVTLIGERGKATLSMPVHRAWTFDISGGVHKHVDYGLHNDFRAALGWFPADGTKSFYWLDACRCQEVAEAVDRSLARGRTIELFNEQHTEEQSFKGVMAMGGCLLLMMALAVVGLATIVEGLQLPLRDWPAWHWWPVALLVPVVVFLLLQLLQLAVKRETAA
jgi:hypothetical protein